MRRAGAISTGTSTVGAPPAMEAAAYLYRWPA